MYLPFARSIQKQQAKNNLVYVLWPENEAVEPLIIENMLNGNLIKVQDASSRRSRFFTVTLVETRWATPTVFSRTSLTEPLGRIAAPFLV